VDVAGAVGILAPALAAHQDCILCGLRTDRIG
jgi:hypothetical protein